MITFGIKQSTPTIITDRLRRKTREKKSMHAHRIITNNEENKNYEKNINYEQKKQGAYRSCHLNAIKKVVGSVTDNITMRMVGI